MKFIYYILACYAAMHGTDIIISDVFNDADSILLKGIIYMFAVLPVYFEFYNGESVYE